MAGEVAGELVAPGGPVDLVLGECRLRDATARRGRGRDPDEHGDDQGSAGSQGEATCGTAHHTPRRHAGAAVGSAPIWDMIVKRSQYWVISTILPSRTRNRSHSANFTRRPLAGTPAKSAWWVAV